MTLSPFELSVVPVTCDTYRPFDASADDSAARKGHPVTGVSWWDAWLFSRWVGGRLPTEAEWECACRAGTTTPWSTGSRETSLGQGAWYSANSKGTTHPVGTKAPNSWGFHDLHGNVWEWCADRFGPYPESPQRDPTGPASGAHRVLRGGGYWDVAVWCRSAYRGNWRPGFRDADHGFRVAFPAFPPSLVNLEPSSFED